MRVLVTGGTGFVGGAVAGELRDHGHDVLVLSRSGQVSADLTDAVATAKALAPLEIEGVCHLAALTSVRDSFADPAAYFATNDTATRHLLDQLPEGVPFVLASTSAVYGSARPGKLREDMPANPENPYAASKLAAEEAVTAKGGVVLRCFNVAGSYAGRPDPDPTRIISAALRAAAGMSTEVFLNGDGSAVREFTHVTDVARAFRLALEAPKPGILNVGTGQGHTMMEVVRAAEAVTGRPIAVMHRPPAAEAHTLVSDPTRIREQLGWQPTRSQLETIIGDAWQALVSR